MAIHLTLVLALTYTSIEAIAHRFMLPGFLVRYPFDNMARVREYAGPIFFEHGNGNELGQAGIHCCPWRGRLIFLVAHDTGVCQQWRYS